jgi:hypothetical protein
MGKVVGIDAGGVKVSIPIYTTDGVSSKLSREDIQALLVRFRNNDWGDGGTHTEDRESNLQSLKNGGTVYASYKIRDVCVYVIMNVGVEINIMLSSEY